MHNDSHAPYIHFAKSQWIIILFFLSSHCCVRALKFIMQENKRKLFFHNICTWTSIYLEVSCFGIIYMILWTDIWVKFQITNNSAVTFAISSLDLELRRYHRFTKVCMFPWCKVTTGWTKQQSATRIGIETGTMYFITSLWPGLTSYDCWERFCATTSPGAHPGSSSFLQPCSGSATGSSAEWSGRNWRARPWIQRKNLNSVGESAKW